VARSSTLGLVAKFKSLVFGRPIPTSREHHERLSLFFGLPVFASDALSSAAYATEAILSILLLYSVTAMSLQPAITIAICLLYAIVVISYQQTVYAYPSGGGSYIVAADNLGEKPALVAGAALLIDYILTVAVSIAAGVAAIVSAFPELHSALVPLNIAFIAFIAWANLRGVRESGMMFALPSYGFVVGMVVMIVCGVLKLWGHDVPRQTVLAEPGAIGGEATLPLILSSCDHFQQDASLSPVSRRSATGCKHFGSPSQEMRRLALGGWPQ
jgi:amino acid transporter